MEKKLTLSRSLLPLEIPCILQQILKYMPHAELKVTRLVSTTFNEEASRILRKRSKIVLNGPKRLLAFDLSKVDKFCECIQLIQMSLATPSVTSLLNKFGKYVKSLDLKDAKWSCEEFSNLLTQTVVNLEELVVHGAIPKDARRLFTQPKHTNNEVLNVPSSTSTSKKVSSPLSNSSLPEGETEEESKPVPLKLPKIKQLDLQLYDKAPDEDCLQQFLADILSTSYNLEVLRSRDTGKWRNRRERFHRILFELLIDPEVNLILPKLRRVSFSLTPWGDVQIQRLAAKQFPLSYLNLSILPDISTNSIISLLISLRHSLTKLKLSFTYWRITELPCDMNLYNLQHLSLDWFNGSLKFVSHLKNLQVLILAQVDLNDIFTDKEVAGFKKPHAMLYKFEVYQHSGAVVLPETVQLVSTIFPCVKTLVIGKLNDYSLRAVFSYFPLLEEFSAIEGVYTDFGLTGIAMETCKVCGQKHLPELCRGLYDEDFVNQQRKFAYIADLKNLRKLEIKSPYLTNLSVIHGIAHCQRLGYLSLWCYELTFKALKKIVDTLTNLNYLETTHTFSRSTEIQYALTKMHGHGRTFILNGLEAPKSKPLTPAENRGFLAQFRICEDEQSSCRNILSNLSRHDPSCFLRESVFIVLKEFCHNRFD